MENMEPTLTETTVPVLEIPVEVPVEVPIIIPVEVPVVVPVIDTASGEELTAWQNRVEQTVNQQSQNTAAILEAIQSQREINSSNQTCLLRMEVLLNQLTQKPPILEPVPEVPIVPIVPAV